jgi:Aspartyl protease
VSGLLISRATAQHSGLKPIYQNDVLGTGAQATRSGFVGIADSIAIGDVEFHNCAVQVMDVNFANGAEGIIGLEILSSYLITLDYPAKKLLLETLPARPQELVASSGLYNRYIAPTMKDYAPALVSGSDLIVPLSLNGSSPRLFVLDTAIGESTVSPGAAYELTTGHRDIKFENRDSKASWNVISLTGDNNLNFAGVSLKESPIFPFDTSRFTDDSGMEISGMLGLKLLSRMTIHIDYRDGLMKFDYDPARKGPILF